MLDEKFYTVADVARVTGLTDRTIRNYLKDGSLRGSKVGAQWRFTEDEIRKLFLRQQPGMETPGTLVKAFMGNEDQGGEIGLVVLDLPASDEGKAKEIFGKFEIKKTAGIEKLSFEFRESQKTVRIAAVGSKAELGKLLADKNNKSIG